MPNEPLKDLEDAEAAYKRVEPEATALTEDQFTALNVDVIAATSIILGVAPRILAFRERIASLPEFNMRHVDGLEDYAKGAWYAVITNLPEPEPSDFQAMFDECATLRNKLLTWALPLVLAKKFEQQAIDKIKEGSGNKDVPSDVVALVVLYRSKWDDIRSMCGVTEEELARGAAIAPSVFASVSRRENQTLPSQAGGSLRVRRFWTLADRSYDQCQRAINYLQHGVGDAAVIAPSLRRNAGGRPTSSAQGIPAPTDAPVGPLAPAPAGPGQVGGLGGGGGPFVR